MELYAEKLLQASRITKGTRKTDFCFCNGERATDRSAMAFCSSTYISIDFLSIEAYRSGGGFVKAQLGVEPSRMKRELGGGRRLGPGGFRSRKSGVWRRPAAAALRGLDLGSSPVAARRPSAARRKSRRPPVPARLDATPA